MGDFILFFVLQYEKSNKKSIGITVVFLFSEITLVTKD